MHQGKGIGANLPFKITAFRIQFKIKKSAIVKILTDFTHISLQMESYRLKPELLTLPAMNFLHQIPISFSIGNQ
jgi:hypothetical protein